MWQVQTVNVANITRLIFATQVSFTFRRVVFMSRMAVSLGPGAVAAQKLPVMRKGKRTKGRRTKNHRADVMKRCKSCKKQKPHSEFYAAKAECRDCSHVQTNVLRQVRRQKETAWYDTLSEVEKENMNKTYVKVKKDYEKDPARVASVSKNTKKS